MKEKDYPPIILSQKIGSYNTHAYYRNVSRLAWIVLGEGIKAVIKNSSL
jgi:hypothetical protein